MQLHDFKLIFISVHKSSLISIDLDKALRKAQDSFCGVLCWDLGMTEMSFCNGCQETSSVWVLHLEQAICDMLPLVLNVAHMSHLVILYFLKICGCV